VSVASSASNAIVVWRILPAFGVAASVYTFGGKDTIRRLL
jgi:hypothetical protein